MSNKLATYLIILVMFLLLLMWANNIYATDWEKEYFQEEVTYVVAYGKPFPEMTAFSCEAGRLKKSWNYVRDHKGKHVKCEFKTMTRQEYEDLNNVTRTF